MNYQFCPSDRLAQSVGLHVIFLIFLLSILPNLLFSHRGTPKQTSSSSSLPTRRIHRANPPRLASSHAPPPSPPAFRVAQCRRVGGHGCLLQSSLPRRLLPDPAPPLLLLTAASPSATVPQPPPPASVAAAPCVLLLHVLLLQPPPATPARLSRPMAPRALATSAAVAHANPPPRRHPSSWSTNRHGR